MSDNDSISDYNSEPEEQRLAEQQLADRIFSKLVTSKFDLRAHDFLPDDFIEELITKDAIQIVLGLGTGSAPISAKEKKFVDWIHSKARRLFAIIVYCGLVQDEITKSLKKFRVSEFTDGSLPIEKPRGSEGQALSRQFYFMPGFWNAPRLGSFWDHQWKFNVPIFDVDTYNYDLPSESIFPFTWKDESVKEGAFSCVYRVRIHTAHQKHELEDVRTSASSLTK